MDGFFRVENGCCVPADDRTAKCLRGFEQGEVLTVTIHPQKSSRDIVRHNQFFAVLARAVDNMDYNITCNADTERAIDDLTLKLKYAAGFTVQAVDIDGVIHTLPRSISFGDCTEAECEEFRVKAYNVLCLLLKCTRRELFGV